MRFNKNEEKQGDELWLASKLIFTGPEELSTLSITFSFLFF